MGRKRERGLIGLATWVSAKSKHIGGVYIEFEKYNVESRKSVMLEENLVVSCTGMGTKYYTSGVVNFAFVGHSSA